MEDTGSADLWVTIPALFGPEPRDVSQTANYLTKTVKHAARRA